MKLGKWFRVVGLAVVLCLIVMPLAALPVSAASESIELDPEEGEIGEEIDVTGEDFDESYDNGGDDYEDFYVSVYFSDEEFDEGDDIDDLENYEILDSSEWVDEDGEWDISFDVPDELTDGEDDITVGGGTYYVYVTYEDDDEIVAMAEFTVMASEIELDTDEGPVGTEVEISGTDFEDGDDIDIDFDGDSVSIESGDEVVDDDEFTLTILIPEGTAGEHTITVADESDNEAEATFTIEPEIVLGKTTGAPGDTVSVNGTGFGKSVDVSVEFDGTELNSTTTDNYGSFSVGIKLPTRNSGSYEVNAEDEDDNEASADFLMAAGITLSPDNGHVGSQVTVDGTGFTANASVNVSYAGEAVASATVDATGKFSATFNVPQSLHGAQTVTATEGANTATATYTMESIPPAVPSPLEPVQEDKASAAAYFDWDEVTDDSGVTYSLQVATSTDFSAAFLVVDKTDIATSEYTLTKEEKLQSTDKEAPYYWRIQAVDGAGNESGWTTPGSFYVGFSMSFPTWAWYVVGALGAILIILIGFLLGRRTSYL